MRNYKNFDLDNFLDDLNNSDWESVRESNDADEAYNMWKTLFTNVCDKHCPYVTRRVRKSFLPWIDDDIKEDIRMKHYFHKKAHAKGLEIFWQMFRHFRNVVANSLKAAKRDYYTSLILENKHKPKLMWKYLRELLPGKSKATPKGLLIDGQIITDRKQMADAYNQYFTSVGKDLASKIPNTNPYTPPDPSTLDVPRFKFPSVTADFV